MHIRDSSKSQYRNSKYLTPEELSQQSGLLQEDLRRLMEIRLLVPDTADGCYRPKLVNWARKLAFLINEGWDFEEIKRWAKGRFMTENPKQWPPERDKWIS